MEAAPRLPETSKGLLLVGRSRQQNQIRSSPGEEIRLMINPVKASAFALMPVAQQKLLDPCPKLLIDAHHKAAHHISSCLSSEEGKLGFAVILQRRCILSSRSLVPQVNT